jgi:hypothetical protein
MKFNITTAHPEALIETLEYMKKNPKELPYPYAKKKLEERSKDLRARDHQTENDKFKNESTQVGSILKELAK